MRGRRKEGIIEERCRSVWASMESEGEMSAVGEKSRKYTEEKTSGRREWRRMRRG